MVRTICRTLSLGLLAATLLAQAPPTPPSKKAAPGKAEAPAAAKQQGLTVDSIIAMVQAGLSEDLIVARLRKEERAFDLSPDEMIRLKKAGVSDAIVKVMLDPKADIEPATSPPAAHSTAPTPVVVQTPVVPVLTPLPNPSGATPSPGAISTGDPNDPMTPHDSGVWLYTKDRDGNPKMIVLERAAYQGTRTGGLFTSSITAGLKKAKMKAVIAGERASIRTSDAQPIFYFYFEDKAAGLGKSYFGMGGLSSPNQFVLIRLDVKKSHRETIIGEFGSLGMSMGTDVKSMIAFKSERIRPGLYKVVPTKSLSPGEYCFLASAGFGAYGSGADAAVEIFDFAVTSTE